MHDHEQHYGEGQRREHDQASPGRHEVGQERVEQLRERERQGSRGYSDHRIAGNQERHTRSQYPGYGYRPAYSSDWWGPYAGRGPKSYQRSDERIREDICEHLTVHPAIDASEIVVVVTNGEVTLSGSVESRAIRRLVEALTDAVPGVKDIHNNLQVSQGSPSGHIPPR
jgi:hypothetical protein